MTAQGYGAETTWSRGQAWSIYGFTQTYSYTRDDSNVASMFLDAACRNANYFISHLPNNYTADKYNHVAGDFVPPTDFDAALGEPAGPWNDADHNLVFGDPRPGTFAYVQRDSSAAAIAASGLLELSTLVDDANLQDLYFGTAQDILWCLMTFKGTDGKLDYLAKDSTDMGILTNARGAYGTPGYSMIVADYYFLEALQRYDAIPEPACMTILLAGLALWPRRRRRT
jgi:unsaturated chondroitin disaccharide hydrolase